MEFILDLIAITVLFAAFTFSKRGAKSWAIAAILFVYVFNMRFQSASFYGDVLTYIGYYVSQSFFELLVVGLLLLLPSKEAILIMGLCLFSVIVNIAGYSAEYLGYNPKSIVSSSMWALFGLQLLILFSQGITDVLFRGASAFSMVRTYCSNHLEIDTKS